MGTEERKERALETQHLEANIDFVTDRVAIGGVLDWHLGRTGAHVLEAAEQREALRRLVADNHLDPVRVIRSVRAGEAA